MRKYSLLFIFNILTTTACFASLNDNQIFQKLSQLHQDFKQEKDKLFSQLKQSKISQKEFDEKSKDLKKSFEDKKDKLKAQIQLKEQYSLTETQKNLEINRKKQAQEEAPLKEQFLSSTNYDRKKFDELRKPIERKYELSREFINLFTQAPKNETERAFIDAINAQKEILKEKLITLRKKYLKDDYTESYTDYQRFAKELQELIQEDSSIREYLTKEFEDAHKSTTTAAAAATGSEETEDITTLTEAMNPEKYKEQPVQKIPLLQTSTYAAKGLAKMPPSKL